MPSAMARLPTSQSAPALALIPLLAAERRLAVVVDTPAFILADETEQFFGTAYHLTRRDDVKLLYK